MCCAKVKIRLANSLRPELSPVEVEALVDNGQPHLHLPVRLATRLGLETVCSRIIPAANGEFELCPYVGPLEMQLGGQSCFVGAVVGGWQVRIGSAALASMNLAVDPATRKLTAAPIRLTRFETFLRLVKR